MAGAESNSELTNLDDGSFLDFHPVCRRNALQAIGDFGNSAGEHYCRHMSFQHQELFAIELTKCHLHGTGDDVFNGPCDGFCLNRLTDRAFTSFTTFKVHVEHFCIKANYDLMLLKQQEMDAKLLQTAHKLSVSFNEIDLNLQKSSNTFLSQLSALIEHQSEMKEENARLFSSFRDEQTELHENLLHQALQRQVELHHKSVEHQEKQGEQLHHWMQTLMVGQTEEIQRQHQQLDRLSTAIGNTAAQLTPLFGLDYTFSWISSGVRAIHLMTSLYITLNVIWILTIPKCVRSCRRKLWGLALMECLILWLVLSGEPEDKEHQEVANSTKLMFYVIYSTVYLLSFVSSFFLKRAPSPDEQHAQQQQEFVAAVSSIQATLERLDQRCEDYDRQLGDVKDMVIRILEDASNHRRNLSLSPQIAMRPRQAAVTPAQLSTSQSLAPPSPIHRFFYAHSSHSCTPKVHHHFHHEDPSECIDVCEEALHDDAMSVGSNGRDGITSCGSKRKRSSKEGNEHEEPNNKQPRASDQLFKSDNKACMP